MRVWQLWLRRNRPGPGLVAVLESGAPRRGFSRVGSAWDTQVWTDDRGRRLSFEPVSGGACVRVELRDGPGVFSGVLRGEREVEAFLQGL